MSAFFVLVLLVGGGCTPQSFETQDSLEKFSVYLDRHIPRLMDQYRVPGVSMAIIRDGELVWSGAYGYADLDHERAMTVDAICRAESISKSVTAWGVIWNETFHSALTIGYELKGSPVPPYVYPTKASGGLFADVKGIACFVIGGMTDSYYKDRSVLGQESIRTLYTPEVEIPGLFGIVADSYGFGYFIETLSDGRQAVWHGGQGHGWMTHFHSVPESGDGIVILTNSQRSWPLIAEVLTDWARWSGFGSVKFGRITRATTALRVLIGIVVLVSLWQVYRLVQGLRNGKRRLAPLSSKTLVVRLLQAALGIGGIAVLAWSAAQPYLFVSSVFPGTAGWAGVSFLLLAVTMVVSALLPRFED